MVNAPRIPEQKFYTNASDMVFAKIFRNSFAPNIDISRSLLASDESKYYSNWCKLIEEYHKWRNSGSPLII